jgi:hypothetical protein
MPGFAAGIDATTHAAEVSGDGTRDTPFALPICTDSSGSPTIPFMILEVDTTFKLEHFAGAGTTALRRASRRSVAATGSCGK